MKTNNQQPVDLNDLLHKIKSGELDYQARSLVEMSQDARKNLKLSRQQFYKNLTTFQWGKPRVEYSSGKEEWYHEVSYDRRAMIEDSRVLLLAWPWRGEYPQHLEKHTEFLGYRMQDEFHCHALIRVLDDDARWEWQSRFIQDDKESCL
jgi:hypothetical protein